MANPQRRGRSLIGDGTIGEPKAAAGDLASPDGFVPVSGVLTEFLDRSGIGESLERLGAVDEWAVAVGPRIGRVTRAVEVQGDVLVVEARSSAWINELSMMSGLILERVNAGRAGAAIRRVRFRLAERRAHGRG